MLILLSVCPAMAGLLYFKFGTQKSGIDHHFAPYVRDLVPDTTTHT